MGMFDYLRCKMPLPVDVGADHTEHWFQTKSLACELDYLEIREDGTLWRQKYETIDSEPTKDGGLAELACCRERVNKQWLPCLAFTGEIVFYTFPSFVGELEGQCYRDTGWIELSSYFVGGELKQFHLLRYDPPQPVISEEDIYT